MRTNCPNCGAHDQLLGSQCQQCQYHIPNTITIVSYDVVHPNMTMVPVQPPPAPKKDHTNLWIALATLALVALCCVLGTVLLLNVLPAYLPNAPAPTTFGPAIFPPVAAPVTTSPASLNYDETNADALTPGQKQLIALYLRIPAPITQAQLESAVAQIQQEAAATNAEVHEGSTLTLDQNRAWMVWCSDATQVDPPADVSLVHELTLLAPNTVGRVWIQVPFAQGVPLRTDDTWTGCNGTFWAVFVH